MQKSNEEIWTGRLEGATTLEISILGIIEKKPDVILKEIIESLGIANSTLTSAVDRLEKRGLIERVISKKDRRSFGLALTGEGLLAQAEHREREKLLWQKILGSYDTSKERMELIKLLEILAKNL
jgi:DNA-binding MarR family transcriptional regulator